MNRLEKVVNGENGVHRERSFKFDFCQHTKKKYALMFGYSGVGYSGLQINPGVKTIEEDLERAIVKSGVIKEENSGDLRKSQWTRAGRTDKGVHALGQVVGIKMGLKEDLESQEKFRAELNKN